MISWPLPRQGTYESINNDGREGFLGAVGKIDGTDIVLNHKPGGIYNGETFFTRKKVYTLDLCVVCDLDRRFIHILAGWPHS